MPKLKTEKEVEKEIEKAEEKAGFEVLGVYKATNDGRKTCIREYSIATHGKDAQKNAEEYAKKKGGTVEKIR